MGKKFELQKIAEYADMGEIIGELSEKELLNSDFSDEYNNIARDHKLIQMLWAKVKVLEQQVKRLEEKK